MKKTILVSAALLSCSLVYSAGNDEWIQYAESTNDAKLFIKPSAAKKINGIWHVWIKQVPKQPEPIDEGNPKGKKWSYAIAQQAISCQDQTLGNISRTEYAANGASLGTYDIPSSLKPPIPDSTGEMLVNTVCKYIDNQK